jgi:hypothetical protein
MINPLHELALYALRLDCEKLDSEIMGTEFKHQKEADALEQWAHSVLEAMDNEDDEFYD